MKKKILALVLAFTMCFGTTMTANAAMIVKNDMSGLGASNVLDKNSTGAPKNTLQYVASKFKIEYTQEDLDALKKIFDANLYAKAYPDVAAAYGNDREALWNHYVTHGIKEGRTQINSGFNVFAYISAYPDLRNAFGDDLMAYYVHYANYGMNENRKLITVDAVTKAGYTITGINGQVIAVPKLEPAPSTVESVTEPDPAPAEEPTPTQEATPTQETTPTQEESSGTTCNHEYDGMKQIEGTTTHGSVCIKCGYVDKEQAESCVMGSYVSINDSLHNEICSRCNGVIKEELHQFEDGVCKACEYKKHTNHEWDHDTGKCKECEAVCTHSEWNTDEGVCKICGKRCEHSYGNWEKLDENQHKHECSICHHAEQEGHKWTSEAQCELCGCQSDNKTN